MCDFKSGEAVKASDSEVEVFMSEKTESHTAIRAEHGIREVIGPMDRTHTPITLLPVRGIEVGNPEMWSFEFEDDRPDWWTEEMTRQATDQMLTFIAKHHFGARGFHHPGDVCMSRLAAWPEGVPFRCGRDARLLSLTRWPPGTPFECGRHAYLSSLTAWPAGTPFRCPKRVWTGTGSRQPQEWLAEYARCV